MRRLPPFSSRQAQRNKAATDEPQTMYRLSSFVLVAGFVGVPVLLTWRAVRQARLDRALIAAVKENNTQSVVSLLAQGADANARNVPPDTRPFWRQILTRLRRIQPQERPSYPALLVAL